MTARLPRFRGSLILLGALAAAAALVPAGAPKVFAAPPPIVLDGDFSDWDGRVAIADTDQKHEPKDQRKIKLEQDIQRVYFATNEGEPWLYFRVDRYPRPTRRTENGIGRPVYYGVFIDYNNNRNTTDPTDRWQGYQDPEDFVLYCAYTPDPAPGQPIARVYLVPAPAVFGADKVDPGAIIWQAQGDWGQPYDKRTGTGGLSVEFGVPFSAFEPALSPGQPIKFFFGATLRNPLEKLDYRRQDFCPNGEGIDWAPVSTLGLVGTILLLGTGVTVAYLAFRRRLGAGAPNGVTGR